MLMWYVSRKGNADWHFGRMYGCIAVFAHNDWIKSHMHEWLLLVWDSWPSGRGAEEDAACQLELKFWMTMKQTWKTMPVYRETS